MSSSSGMVNKPVEKVSYKLKYKLLKRCIKEIVLVGFFLTVFLSAHKLNL